MTELLTPNQVARHIHMSPRTLEQWRAIGYGPRFARLGRRVVYRRVDVESWLTSKFD